MLPFSSELFAYIYLASLSTPPGNSSPFYFNSLCFLHSFLSPIQPVFEDFSSSQAWVLRMYHFANLVCFFRYCWIVKGLKILPLLADYPVSPEEFMDVGRRCKMHDQRQSILLLMAESKQLGHQLLLCGFLSEHQFLSHDAGDYMPPAYTFSFLHYRKKPWA